MSAETSLHTTPLHALHLVLNARMVGFAGYEMPLQYPAGIMKEHLHTRSGAGLFDVSHMGQLTVRARSGKMEDAALALESLVPVDILGLSPNRQRYGLFTNDRGGIIDDLMIAHLGDHFFLVVNASCKTADEAHLRERISDTCIIENLSDRALIALQGPKAEAALASLVPGIESMRFMDIRTVSIQGAPGIVSRSGYTGEDGFEISIPASHAERFARTLLENDAVAPVGLGARDSLRLEAGLCLHGSDIDASTTPIEAALEWALQKARRQNGSREGHFPGDAVILKQLSDGAPRRRVGLQPEGRAPVRAGTKLFAGEKTATPVGSVTSGCFGPSVQAPIAMGYVETAHATNGQTLFADVRGQRIAVRTHELPFVPHSYKRK